MPVVTRDVKSLSKSGDTKLKGDVTLSGGAGVALTQSGQDISIATSYTDTAPNVNVKARAYLGTNQTLTTATTTKVQLNTESYDVGGDFDNATNYRFTIPVNGYYLINAKVKFANSADLNERFLINVYVDGAATFEVLRGSSYTVGAAGRSEDITFSDVGYFTANQYLELYARHDFGVDSNILAGARNTFLSVHLLSI